MRAWGVVSAISTSVIETRTTGTNRPVRLSAADDQCGKFHRIVQIPENRGRFPFVYAVEARGREQAQP